MEKRGFGLLNKELERVVNKIVDDNEATYKRYLEHASLLLIKRILMSKLQTAFYKTFKRVDKGSKLQDNDISNSAYSASVVLFEEYLEYGCQISSNGHHRAQDFSEMFKNEFNYSRNKELIIK